MKKIKFISLFIFAFMMYFGFNVQASAKEESFYCDYKLGLSNNNYAIFIRAIGYDDNSYEVKYMEEKDVYVDISKYKWAVSKVYISNMGSDPTSIIDIRSLSAKGFKAWYENLPGTSQCPVLVGYYNGTTTMFVEFSDSGSGYDQYTSGEFIVKSEKQPVVENKPELVSQCDYSSRTGNISGLESDGAEMSFRRYSDGATYFCVGNSVADINASCITWNDGEDAYGIMENDNEKYTVWIEKDEYDKFFIVNEATDKKYLCAEKVYFVYESLVDKTFRVTTDKKIFDDYNKFVIGGNGGSLADNNNTYCLPKQSFEISSTEAIKVTKIEDYTGREVDGKNCKVTYQIKNRDGKTESNSIYLNYEYLCDSAHVGITCEWKKGSNKGQKECFLKSCNYKFNKIDVYSPICSVFKPPESDGKVLPLIKNLYKLLKIAIPVVVFALTVAEFLKVLFSGEEKTMKDAFQATYKRLILMAVLILLPFIVEFIIRLAGISENCLQHLL